MDTSWEKKEKERKWRRATLKMLKERLYDAGFTGEK
jgi:hypothetical protein